MFGRKNSVPVGKAGEKTTVLVSSSVLPYVYQTWRDDTELLFKSKNLHKFLTGITPSIFSEPEPKFCWQLETDT
jgi:hypothetical protein